MAAIMSDYLVRYTAVNAAIQFGFFSVSAYIKSEKYFDLACLVIYGGMPLLSLYDSSTRFPRQVALTGAVVLWSLRLGIFMMRRTHRTGGDRRFDGVRENPLYLFGAYLFQGVWSSVYLLPLYILNATAVDAPLCARDYIGAGVWLAGFLIEAVADNQKAEFRSKPENKDKFITSGLWSVSRHPNYFGDILMAVGVYLISTVPLQDWRLCAGLALSPLFTGILLAKVTGVPILEKSALKRWGDDPRYKKYISTVPELIPYVY